MFTPKLDILPLAQRKLWPSLVQVPGKFVLYGGTAIALRLGHRESLDFDFFSETVFGDAEKEELLTGVDWLNGAAVLQNDLNSLTVSVMRGNDPIKLSFFGGIRNGCVKEPEKTDDDVVCVASMDDLFAHKLKVIHDRAEGKDYQDIASMLLDGQSLARGLAAKEALFGPIVPAMVTLKALAYFNDINESWRLTDVMKSAITVAINRLPNQWEPATIVSHTLRCTVRFTES